VPVGRPPRPRVPRELSGYLEAITRAVFRARMSWSVVDSKWAGIRTAFAGFDPARVAAMDAADIDSLMADPRVIRNRAKLEATVNNAETLLELDTEHNGVRRYLQCQASFEDTVPTSSGSSDSLATLAPTTSYTWWVKTSLRTRAGRRGTRGVADHRDGRDNVTVIRRTQVIGRPVAAVFAVVVDGGHYDRWNPTVSASRKVDDRDIGEGAQFEWKLKGFGHVVQELQDFELNRQVRIVPRTERLAAGHHFVFTPQGNSTRIDHELTMTPQGALRLLTPLVAVIGHRNLRETANALRAYLETQ
jgi:hypothetical protein